MVLKKIEQTFIGSLLKAPKKIIDIIDLVKVEHFTHNEAREVYSEIITQFKNGGIIDFSSILLARREQYTATFMSECSGLGASILVLEYANRIVNLAKERRIDERLLKITTNNILSADEKLEEILDIYQSELMHDKKGYSINEVMTRFENHVKLNKKRGSMGIKTGIRFLEELYIEYVPGHIWLMGGYTSTGKTAMMVQKICRLIEAHDKISILVISTEMTEQQLLARILSNFTGVHSQRILSGEYRVGEEELVEHCKTALKKHSITLCDDVYNKSDIEAVFRRSSLQGGIDVAFIDYVQNCKVPEAKSEYQANSDLAKCLQKLAKDTECCVVCLSQVSNNVGRGETDQFEMKGAGEWAAVADIGVHLKRSKTDKYALKYAIKKHRHGALGEADFSYINNFTALSC